MPQTDIGSARASDMTTVVEDITVDTKETEGPSDLKETTWTNSKWTQYFGYYKKIPELKTAIDMRAIWTIGKGYTADIRTSVILDRMKGWGTDTFDGILKNMVIIRRVGGDSYCEIIKDKHETLLNLKPLDPGKMKHVVNKEGMLIRYEYLQSNGKWQKFEPFSIFHLTNKRVADEIHGTSDIEAIEDIIKANYESFIINKDVIKKYSRPMMKFTLDTDKQSKIDALVAKFDAAVSKGENLYIPKGTVEHDLISVPSNATLNILPWRQHLRDYFFQVVGIPQIILGSSGEFTESTAKIAYLAFQQSVEDEQLDIEEQVWRQLFLKIELTFPATMQNELISDTEKDKAQGAEIQPADTTVTPVAPTETPVEEEVKE